MLLAPEDADARDLAEAAAWFLGDERVALLPSRGVRWDSGLEPPPHLVGERARALDVLAARRPRRAPRRRPSRKGCRRERARPDADPDRAPADEASLEQLSEPLALAGYERVERAEERGQFAVRGGLVDVFPTTGREPLRIEFFGDEIEQIRAFSPFTQRALHPVDEAVVYPAAERRLDLVEPTLATTTSRPAPDDLVPVLPGGRISSGSSDEVRTVWEEEGFEPVGSSAPPGSTRFRPASRSRSRRSGPRSPRAASPKPRTS